MVIMATRQNIAPNYGKGFLEKLGLEALHYPDVPWVNDFINKYGLETLNPSDLLFGWNEMLGSPKNLYIELKSQGYHFITKKKEYPSILFEAHFIPNGITLTDNNRIPWPATLAELAYFFSRLSSNATCNIKGEHIIPINDKLHVHLAANFIGKNGNTLNPHKIAVSLNKYKNFIDVKEGIYKPQPLQDDYKSIAKKLQKLENIITAIKTGNNKKVDSG